MRNTLITILFVAVFSNGFSQDRFEILAHKLEVLSDEYQGLNAEVELSVSNSDVKEFIRAISNINQLNVAVAKDVNGSIVNSFSDARVKDVFLFLCKEYNLDIQVLGSIISFVKYIPPPIKPKPKPKKEVKVYVNDSTGFLSLDLKKDTLSKVVEELTKKASVNVIMAPGIENHQVSIFLQNRPIDKALENFAFANNLSVEKKENNLYIFSEPEKEEDQETSRKSTQNKGSIQMSFNENVEFEIREEKIFLKAFNQPIKDIINLVSSELELSYFLFSEPKGNTTLTVENASYEDFLKYLLNGTTYTYKKEIGIYLIGEKNTERLRKTEMIQLQNRTIESLSEIIPAEVKKGLEIKEFTELNSFVVTGGVSSLYEFKEFIGKVDKVVPVVLIEIIIADITKNHNLTTGINAGLSSGNSDGESNNSVQAPDKTSGKVFPGVDVNLSTGSINELINRINQFDVVNLGKVTPQFYLTLKALEENGVLKTRSTPKLSTINGHEASLSVGTQEYYLEVSNNVIGSQNPSFVTTQNYRSVNADLSVNIKPIVSGNEYVTLEIDVKQSDFTARVSPNAPPGSVSRNFKSTTRVKNNEMIVLGGLEEKSINDSGSGVPLLSRIPILKWLFSSRTKQQGKTKLTIFIKPTIIY